MLEILQMILFVGSVLAVALFTASALRLSSRPATLLSIYLLCWANIVAVSELTATFGLLNYQAFLLCQMTLVFLVGLIWHRLGKPSLLGPFSPMTSVLDGARLQACVKAQPALTVLGLAVLVAYAIGAYLVLKVPPNNWDSMAYHLSRVGYWLQNGSFYPWPTPDPRQTTFPFNAEIGILWTIFTCGTDRLAGFIQWIAVPATMTTIYGFARLIGGSRSQAAFAALLFATFPEIVLQSTSTQNDLVACSFFAASIYLFYLGLNSEQKSPLLMSGVAFGLAMGTKFTVPLLLPGLAVTLVLLWFHPVTRGSRGRMIWTAFCWVGGFMIFGAYPYMLNWLFCNYPLGPPHFVKVHTSGSQVSVREMLTANMARYFYQFVDFTGFPVDLANKLQELKASGAAQVFSYLNIPVTSRATTWFKMAFDFHARPRLHEDLAWFGPLSFLLLMPAAIRSAVQEIRRPNPFSMGLLITAIGFFICQSLAHGWNPWVGRFYVLPVALCAPFMASLFRSGFLFGLLRWSVILLAIMVLFRTAVYNESKPMLGASTIWNKDRIGRQAILRQPIEPLLRAIEDNVPAHARIGTMLDGSDWDYPLFGEKFTRTVLPLYPYPTEVDPKELARRNIQFLLMNGKAEAVMGNSVPAGMHVVYRGEHWLLLYRPTTD